jgi:hypothetical protein
MVWITKDGGNTGVVTTFTKNFAKPTRGFKHIGGISAMLLNIDSSVRSKTSVLGDSTVVGEHLINGMSLVSHSLSSSPKMRD